MSNPAVAYDNLILGASLSAAGFISQAAPTKLQDPHVGNKWRHNATSSYIVADLGADATGLPIDTVALMGVSGEDPDFRLRMSLTDSSGALGEVLDTGTISGLPYFDPDYGLFVYLLSTTKAPRYVRIDIAEAGVSYIEAGVWFVGPRNTFSTALQTPWTKTSASNSIKTIGVGGQTFIDLRSGFWKTDAKFDFLSDTERKGFLSEIAVTLRQEGHLDMLWIENDASDNLARDCTWGYVDGDFSYSQSLYVVPRLFSVGFPIRQRL